MCLRAVGRIIFLLVSATTLAQTPTFHSLPAITFESAGPVIRAHSETEKPFTVAGERGVLLGQQNGTFESWVLPVKLLSHLTIEADIEGYGVPIDVNQQSAEIEVRPDRTVITYSPPRLHRPPDHVFAQRRASRHRPRRALRIRLPPSHRLHLPLHSRLRWMWPERNEGIPGPEWVSPDPHASLRLHGGFYVLHTDYPDLAGAITIPGAQPGILAPYQERPQVHPVEFKLHIDPARDHDSFSPC